MRRRFSQREAKRLLRRAEDAERVIENQRRFWSQEYLGATEIQRCQWESLAAIPVAIRTARKLNHAVVCIGEDDGTVRFMALPHPKVAI